MACRGGVGDGAHPGARRGGREAEGDDGVEEGEVTGGRRRWRGRSRAVLGEPRFREDDDEVEEAEACSSPRSGDLGDVHGGGDGR